MDAPAPEFGALAAHAAHEAAVVHNAGLPHRRLPWALWSAILRGVGEEDVARLACVDRWAAALVADARPVLGAAWDAALAVLPSRSLLRCCSGCLALATTDMFALACGHLVCEACASADSVDVPSSADDEHEVTLFRTCKACGASEPAGWSTWSDGDVVGLTKTLDACDDDDDDWEEDEGEGEDGEASRSFLARRFAVGMLRCARVVAKAKERLTRRAHAILRRVCNRIPCDACRCACDVGALRARGYLLRCETCVARMPATSTRRRNGCSKAVVPPPAVRVRPLWDIAPPAAKKIGGVTHTVPHSPEP